MADSSRFDAKSAKRMAKRMRVLSDAKRKAKTSHERAVDAWLHDKSDFSVVPAKESPLKQLIAEIRKEQNQEDPRWLRHAQEKATEAGMAAPACIRCAHFAERSDGASGMGRCMLRDEEQLCFGVCERFKRPKCEGTTEQDV